jgi:predicted metalloprotease with PDZ domain
MGVLRSSTSSRIASERVFAAVIAVAIASCGSPARVHRPGTLSGRARPSAPLSECEGPRVCVIARLDEAARAMEVTLRIDPAALPRDREEVRLVFRSDPFGPRYVEEFVQILDRPAWPVSLGRVEEPTEIRYRVALDFLDRARPAHGRESISWPRPGGWHLTGKTFLPDVVVDGEPAVVAATLRIDTGDLPIFSAAGDRALFDAPSLSRLADEAYEVGPMRSVRREVGSTALLVAASGEVNERALEAAADVLARSLAAWSQRLGAPPTDSVFVAIHSFDEPRSCERLGSSLVQIDPSGVPSDPIYGWTDRAIHELGDLWTPGTRRIPETWLRDGVTDYLAATVASEIADSDRASFARVMMRSHARYAAEADRRTIAHETNGGRWSNDAGLVAGFCLDVQLRESGSSLAAVVRTMLTREESELGAEALFEDLAAVSPSSASYLEALLATEGAFSIDGCLERFGFQAREVSYQGYSDHALSNDVLGGVSIAPLLLAEGFEISAVSEGSHFEAGDVVTAIEGHPVADLDDVGWAIRDLAQSARFHASVRRRGESMQMELTVPWIDDDRREERAYVELAPAP